MRPRRRRREEPVALIVTPRYLPLLGGMERECGLLAEEFYRRGWRPVVITEQLGMDLPRREQNGHVLVHRIPSSEERSLPVQLRVAAAMALLLLRYRRAGFAIIRTTTLPALLVGLLKHLRLISFPTLATAETGGAHDDVAALSRRPLFPLSRALVASHDVLNGLCQANVEHLREFGFPSTKLAMIPNGIDTSAWQTSDPPRRVERFLFLGRIDPEKGLFELLNAFREVLMDHPRITLTVAGDGPALLRLTDLRDHLGLREAVHFVGRVAYERLGQLFESHDCLVLPSYSEGMPLSVLEAAVHRRVLIVTDVGDMRRLFGDRIHLCPPRDVEALAAAMRTAIDAARPAVDYEDVIRAVDIRAVAAAILDRLGPVRVGGPT